MLLATRKQATIALISMIFLLLPINEANSDVGAVLNKEDTLVSGPPEPQADIAEKKTLDMRDVQTWGERFLGESLVQGSFQKNRPRWKNGLHFPLKSSGMASRIELGVEMHSLEAWQSVIPPDRFPKGLDNQTQHPLIPPSSNSPDFNHNGGFLRFKW